MDIEKLRTLLKELTSFMDSSGLSELEVELEGEKVRLKKQSELTVQAAVTPHVTVPVVSAPAAPPAPKPQEKLHTIVSPTVGTFYRAPSPEARPYVDVGTHVEPDTVVCLVEAMKVMNEIKAECTGTIMEILVQNGTPVEFDQPLFVVKPD